MGKNEKESYDEATKRIMSHIVVKDGLNPRVVAYCILNFHLIRTRQHVSKVKAFSKLIADMFKTEDWTSLLKRRMIVHDRDKLEDFHFIGDYAPYIVIKHGPSWLKDMFELETSYPKEWDMVFVVQHVKSSPHHPEYWSPDYDFGENTPPYNVPDMDNAALAEMCADWMATGQEMGNTASEWNKTVGKERYVFTTKQISLIKQILANEETIVKQSGKLKL